MRMHLLIVNLVMPPLLASDIRENLNTEPQMVRANATEYFAFSEDDDDRTVTPQIIGTTDRTSEGETDWRDEGSGKS